MTDIIVQRGAAERPGDDIQEPLLSDPGAALARGRAELDRATLHDERTLTCNFQATVGNGDLLQSHDSGQAETWRGKIIGVSHELQGVEVTTTLRVWRPIP